MNETVTTRYLIFDNLTADQQLARRLPSALALRYHALPVGKNNNHVTVAMANPADKTAREAVATALDAELYVVQSDAAAIDRLLTEVWPEVTPPALRLLLHCHTSPIAGKVRAYAQYLSDLLGGQLDDFETESQTNAGLDGLVEAVSCEHDLVIFGEPDRALLKRLLSGPAGCQVAQRVPASVLVARCPRRPLRHMLLVTRGQAGVDDAAVDWTVRLAQSSETVVTVLGLIPSMSAICQQAMVAMPGGLADWLMVDTPFGQQLRRIALRLADWETTVRLRFRQGSPNRQIRAEVSAENYDLIVIAAEPKNWWLRRLLGEVVNPLLRWADRPVLVAKPVVA